MIQGGGSREQIEANIARLRSAERMDGWPKLMAQTLEDIARLPSAEAAAFIDQVLERGELDAYTDLNGVPCRARLIAAYVNLPWPYALHAKPELVEELRSYQGRRPPPRRWGRIAAIQSGVAVTAFLLSCADIDGPFMGYLILLWFFATIGALGALVMKGLTAVADFFRARSNERLLRR